MLDNLNHSHFIGVLERVLQILEPNSVSESTSSAQERMHSQQSRHWSRIRNGQIDEYL